MEKLNETDQSIKASMLSPIFLISVHVLKAGVILWSKTLLTFLEMKVLLLTALAGGGGGGAAVGIELCL